MSWDQDATIVRQSSSVSCATANNINQRDTSLVTVDRVCNATNPNEDKSWISSRGRDLELAADRDASGAEGRDDRTNSGGAIGIEKVRW